ncbi:hypothetical protein [Salmonella enterica]|uniref:hypothetical protein n=1 Tax=Salmonella enterica TaxID=28901 RepID=UPI000317EF4C|nr:hypothetical protein [Salmonella enterica]
MRSFNVNKNIYQYFLDLRYVQFLSNTNASTEYQHDADLIAQQAKGLGAQAKGAQQPDGALSLDATLNSPDVQKYIAQAEALKKTRT